MGVIQDVVAEERDARAHAPVGVGDELILMEDAIGFVFVDVADIAEGARAAGGIVRIERAGERRIYISRKESVDAVGVNVG